MNRLTRRTLELCAALSFCIATPLRAAGTAEVDWGYHGEHSAANWGELSKDFSACKLGRAQSPVDIRTTEVKRAKLERVDFRYQPSKLHLSNDGHTIQVQYDPGSYIQVGQRRYDLLQFHFHTPGEEEIDGKEFGLGAHLVHRASDGNLAVVAVLFDRGSENIALKKFWGSLPRAAGESRLQRKVTINAADLLPVDRSYYTLSGSLTTPPCSENVRWFVLKTAVAVSKDQLNAFRRIYPMNNRPIQPLNGRTVQASID